MLLRDLVGIPFVDGGRTIESLDCWGLCKLYYKEILGIEINDFKGSAYESQKVFAEYKAQIESNWVEIPSPELHCIVGMANNPDHPTLTTHFGVYVGGGKVLHILRDTKSIIARDTPCVKGYYRWHN